MAERGIKQFAQDVTQLVEEHGLTREESRRALEGALTAVYGSEDYHSTEAVIRTLDGIVSQLEDVLAGTDAEFWVSDMMHQTILDVVKVKARINRNEIGLVLVKQEGGIL